MATKYTDLATGKIFFLASDAAAGVNIDVNGGFHYLVAINSNFYDTKTSMYFVGNSTSYLLDTYPAYAAYSTRQLSSTATNCMIVTEDGTGTEATIGFSAGWLDEAAIATHCGASTGSVAKWYDQSGNGYDVSQAVDATQPEIYDGAAVIKINGKPAPYFQQGSSRLLSTSNTVPSTAQPVQYFWVAGHAGGSGNDYITQTPLHKIGYDGNGAFFGYAGLSSYSTETAFFTQAVGNFLANGSSSAYRHNGTAWSTGDVGANDTGLGLFTIGNDSGGDAVNNVQEYILFASNQSANNAAIETDINTAFGVYA